jgi:hypothetical protein
LIRLRRDCASGSASDDLINRGLRRPPFLIVDGAPGLEKAIVAVCDGVPPQRCTVHKHRNLLAHAPERLHEEFTTTSATGPSMLFTAFEVTTVEVTAAHKKRRRRGRISRLHVYVTLKMSWVDFAGKDG